MLRQLPILSICFALSLALLTQIVKAQLPDPIPRPADGGNNRKIVRWISQLSGDWQSNDETSSWLYENKGEPITADSYQFTNFLPNDAVVFGGAQPIQLPIVNLQTTVNVQTDGVVISQQTGYFTDTDNLIPQQNVVQELGMRISGSEDWTFNGGSISDNFHPDPSVFPEPPDNDLSRKMNVARLTFDGTGSLTLDNDSANMFHDGFLIGNREVDINGEKLPPSIVNAARPDVLGSGEHAGEWANVLYPDDFDDTNVDYPSPLPNDPNLKRYIVQKEGYGIMFTGNGAVINITDPNQPIDPSLPYDETTNPYRVMDNRIYVEEGSTGSILMPQSDTETVVTVSDSYWKNNANFGVFDPNSGTQISSSPIRRGGVIVAENDSQFAMTGNFHFKDNRLLKSIDDQQHPNNVNKTYSVTDTGLDPNTFLGGVLFAGQGVSVDMTGASFSNNGKFAAKTVNADGSATYEFLRDAADSERIVSVAMGGAIYFSGGEISSEVVDPLTGEIMTPAVYATLNVSASAADARTRFQDNAAQMGGAIFVADGTGSTINAANVDFTANRSYQGSGGAIAIHNSRASTQRMQVNLTGSRFDNNVAFDGLNPASGGAVMIQADADVNLSGASFRYNGVLATTQPVDPDDPTGEQMYTVADYAVDTRTLIGGAIAAGENVHLMASEANLAVFEGNAALSDGGVIYIGGGNTAESSGSINMPAAQFVNNHSINGLGGAIYSINTKLDLERSRFEGNTANGSDGTLRGSGGAIYVETLETPQDAETVPVLNVASASFISNEALQNGGAIYIAQDGIQLNVDGAYFRDNVTHSADSLGGAIYAGGSGVTIRGIESRFEYNMYGDPSQRDDLLNSDAPKLGKGLQGGAIYIGDYGTLHLSRAFFNENRTPSNGSDSKGGAIYTGIGTYIDLTEASLTHNWAYNSGGAVYTVGGETTDGTGTLIMDNALFQQNGIPSASSGRATRYGGAVFAGLTKIQGDQVQFSQNEAYTNGGALYVDTLNQATAAIELNDASFERNKAVSGSGGAVYLNAQGGRDSATGETFNVTLNADGTLFLSNTAKQNGGAIFGLTRTIINVNSSENSSAVFGTSNELAESPVGNTAGQHGGAIYLNGDDGNLTSTSQLNAQGATFEYNTAGADGGAVYLRYADADITGVEFALNTAGRYGGALYYENENGKELSVETALFGGNKAAAGGAIYIVNETIVHAKQTDFVQNEATTETGGAINFAAANSQLDITGSLFRNNTANGDGGAVHLGIVSKVVADNAQFFGNVSRNGGGAAIKIGNFGDIHASSARFDGNIAAGPGGAIWIDGEGGAWEGGEAQTQNVLNIDGSRFSDNQSLTGGGGAVSVNYADISAVSATFANNTAGDTVGNTGESPVHGGALFVVDSNLNITGANFTANQATGKGGAVYYQTTDGINRVLNLGAAAGQSNSFRDNLSNGQANSIYFDSTNRTDVLLDVKTDGNGRFTMEDPLMVDETNNQINLDMVKTGTGRWTLGGVNNLGHTSIGTTLDVNEGTFVLANDAELNLRNADESDYVKVAANAGFAAASPKDGNSSIVRTTNLDFAVNSKMQLDGDLTLTVANDYSIGSIISGNGGLIKEDFQNPDGTGIPTTLEFRGATKNFNGDIAIHSGNLVVVKDDNVEDSGRIVTEQGTFTMAPDTHLYLNADSDAPTIVARSATVHDSNIHIGGITGDYNRQFILIHTTDGIIGDFKSKTGDTTELQAVDYLTYNLGFLNDHKDYGGMIGLRWYSTDDTLKAWGKFTLTEADDYFNVGVVLRDNDVNLYPADPMQPGYDPNWANAWNGKTLDKFGLGTLELSQANTYTGKTTVHAGELYVTNTQGTGVGDATVDVLNDAQLGLNFNGDYFKTITGGGQVIVKGGKVELSGANTYTGGTVLKGGALEFSTQRNLGTGTLTFDGGTLRNLAETTLDLPISVLRNRNAIFDVPKDSAGTSTSLTVGGIISGEGGLDKIGGGTLTLTAQNTFAGMSHVKAGGLKIDGSVASDVRVYQDAAVAGNNGSIGANLFMNNGSYFDWYFSPDRSASGPLNVSGNVLLGDVVFRPRTYSTDFKEHITDWTVLTYGGNLNREFAAIDNSFNAFYEFTLDYSVDGEVRVDGELLSNPNPLSDIVTTGLSLANRKLYRNAFAQLMRETVYYKTPNQTGQVRGQVAQASRSAWFTPMARANKFASTYVGGDYSQETYGMQAGTTFWANRHSSLGLMVGYERGSLRNNLDWIRNHDYYLGLYYGYMFSDGFELRSFVGGGIQTFTLARNDLEYVHKSTYDGSSFEWNTEFGKMFAGRNGTIFRPFIAADLETSSISSAQEQQIDEKDIAFRHYGRASLPQFFVRFGADLEKRWQFVDINGGLSYTGLLLGRTHARSPIYYPVRGAGTTAHSARLGRSSLTLKTGVNWHLNRQRTSSLFLDYFADIYMDRAGDTAQHSGNVGLSVRY